MKQEKLKESKFALIGFLTLLIPPLSFAILSVFGNARLPDFVSTLINGLSFLLLVCPIHLQHDAVLRRLHKQIGGTNNPRRSEFLFADLVVLYPVLDNFQQKFQ